MRMCATHLLRVGISCVLCIQRRCVYVCMCACCVAYQHQDATRIEQDGGFFVADRVFCVRRYPNFLAFSRRTIHQPPFPMVWYAGVRGMYRHRRGGIFGSSGGNRRWSEEQVPYVAAPLNKSTAVLCERRFVLWKPQGKSSRKDTPHFFSEASCECRYYTNGRNR